jgi:hypothetical protein
MSDLSSTTIDPNTNDVSSTTIGPNTTTSTPRKEEPVPYTPFIVLIGFGIFLFLFGVASIAENDKRYAFVAIPFGAVLIIVGSVMIDLEKKRRKRLNLK